MDLGGMVGTFVNRVRIESNNPFGLNCGDLIGVGCPEPSSVREGGKETFVYRLMSPRAFHAQVEQVHADMLEEDVPTPPPSPGDRRGKWRLSKSVNSGHGFDCRRQSSREH